MHRISEKIRNPFITCLCVIVLFAIAILQPAFGANHCKVCHNPRVHDVDSLMRFVSGEGEICIKCISLDKLKEILHKETLCIFSKWVSEKNQLAALYGSAGIKLIKVGKKDALATKDLDFLMTSREMADDFLIEVDRVIRPVIFLKMANDIPGSDKALELSPSRRPAGRGPGMLSLAPDCGQFTVFSENEPWFMVEVSVKPEWMAPLDFSSTQYLQNKEIISGFHIPVLTLEGFCCLDALVLENECQTLKASRQPSPELILYSIYSLLKSSKKRAYYKEYFQRHGESGTFGHYQTSFNNLLQTVRMQQGVFQQSVDSSLLAIPQKQERELVIWEKRYESQFSKKQKAILDYMDESKRQQEYQDSLIQFMLSSYFKVGGFDRSGNCFYWAAAAVINRSKVASDRVKQWFYKKKVNRKTEEISPNQVRYLIDRWIRDARDLLAKEDMNLSAGEHDSALFDSLSFLLGISQGQTVQSILDNEFIKKAAPSADATQFYGWNTLSFPVSLVLGMPMSVITRPGRESLFMPEIYSYEKAKELFPDLIDQLQKNPDLVNPDQTRHLVDDMLVLIHSGGDHYYSAEPSGKLKRKVKQYQEAFTVFSEIAPVPDLDKSKITSQPPVKYLAYRIPRKASAKTLENDDADGREIAEDNPVTAKGEEPMVLSYLKNKRNFPRQKLYLINR